LRTPDFRTAARLDDNHLLVSDFASGRVLVTNKDGFVERVLYSGDQPDGIVVARQWNHPPLHPEEDVTVYVTDRRRGCISVIKPFEEGPFNTIVKDTLNQPVGLVMDDAGHLLVADNENHRILIVGKDHLLEDSIGRGLGHQPGQLYCPCGVAFYHGLVLVAEWGNGRVQAFRNGESVLMVEGIPHAHHLIVTPEGTVYVAQYAGNLIRKLSVRIDEHTGSVGFTVHAAVKELPKPPISLFMDGGKLGVVYRDMIEYIEPF
jgi:DNA-binding beta-propeller fold protein YncE